MSPARRVAATVRQALAPAQSRPAWSAGVRAAVAAVAPLLAAGALGVGAGATWMMLGGFIGSLSDKGGPYRVRATALGVVTLGCALSVALGTLAGNALLLAVPLTFALGLAYSLGRVEGNVGTSLAVSGLNTFLIALAFPSPSLLEALSRAGFTLVGGAWAMVLSLLLWPIRPFRPVRLSVARAYRELAAYIDTLLAALAGDRPPTGREPPAGSPLVRAALEESGAALATVRRGRAGESTRGERLLVLRETLDQLFGHLIALGETLVSIPAPYRRPGAQAEITQALTALAALARAAAEGIEAERGSPRLEVAWSGAALRERVDLLRWAREGAGAGEDVAREHYAQAALLLDRMAQYAGAAAANVAALNRGTPHPVVTAGPEVELPERPPLLVELRAALSPGSVALRHALRVGLVAAAAVALAGALGLAHGYWVTITVVIILQPYTGATGRKALQRIAGTVIGGILTALLGIVFHAAGSILVLTFVLSALCVALMPVNYALYSMLLTPTFVLLAEATEGDWGLAWLRVENTLVGGALALLGAYLLWPDPERRRLPAFVAGVLRGNRDYLLRAAALFGERDEHAAVQLRAARRDLALALSNAEDSFQRLLAEHRGPAQELAPAMGLLTYSRRLGASVAALALARHNPKAAAPALLQPLAAFARAAGGILDDLAEALESGRPPAPFPLPGSLPAADAVLPPLLRARVERIARQLKTLHDQVERWSGRSPEPAAPRAEAAA